MRTGAAPLAAALVGLVMMGCGSDDAEGSSSASTLGVSTTGTSDDPSSGSDGSSGNPDGATSIVPTSTTVSGSTDTGDDPTLATSSAGFIYGPPDTDDPAPIECSTFDQDCPADEKCSAWANDGGDEWNATRCVPLAPDPAEIGEACTVEGSGVSGVDDCGSGLACFDVDPETLVGTCVLYCSAPSDTPSCEDPETTCTIEGTMAVCLPS